MSIWCPPPDYGTLGSHPHCPSLRPALPVCNSIYTVGPTGFISWSSSFLESVTNFVFSELKDFKPKELFNSKSRNKVLSLVKTDFINKSTYRPILTWSLTTCVGAAGLTSTASSSGWIRFFWSAFQQVCLVLREPLIIYGESLGFSVTQIYPYLSKSVF